MGLLSRDGRNTSTNAGLHKRRHHLMMNYDTECDDRLIEHLNEESHTEDGDDVKLEINASSI